MRISELRIIFRFSGALCALLLLLSACGTTGTTGTTRTAPAVSPDQPAPAGSEVTQMQKPPEKPPAKTAGEALGNKEVIAAQGRESGKERAHGARAFKGGDLKSSISHWTRALEMNPGAPDIKLLKEDIANTKLLQAAHEAFAREDYAAAHNALDKPKNYGLTKEGALELIKKMRALADERNRAGLRHYVAERIDRAIEEWEAALRIYPGHERALNNLDDARKLKSKMEKVK